MNAYIFIERYEGNSLVREWHWRWPDEAFGPGGPNPMGFATNHRLNDPYITAGILASGCLRPKKSGLIRSDGEYELYHVYVNDLYVCPLCGRFQIGTTSGICSDLLSSTQPNSKSKLYDIRKGAVEFILLPCIKGCHSGTKQAFQSYLKEYRQTT